MKLAFYIQAPPSGQIPRVALRVASIKRAPTNSAHLKRARVLIFVSSDCSICNSYSPEIRRIYDRFKSKADFELIFSEPKITQVNAQMHAAQFGLKGPSVSVDPVGKAAMRYKVKLTPEVAVLDRAGKEVYVGRIDDRYLAIGSQKNLVHRHDLIRAIESVLGGRPVEPASGPPIGCAIEAAYRP